MSFGGSIKWSVLLIYGECDAWSVFSSLSDYDSDDGSALLSFEESD